MMAIPTKNNAINLNNLLKGLGLSSDNLDIEITGIQLDSRSVQKGDLFIAKKGYEVDGATFIRSAINLGAIAVLYDGCPDELTLQEAKLKNIPLLYVENLSVHLGVIASRFYKNPSISFDVVGITGTDGKTSVSQFLAQTLHRIKKDSCAVMGTLGNGIYSALQETSNTTSDPLTLQKMMSDFKAQQVETVVMEVSSHALDQGRVNGTEFDIAVLTNITRDHLDYHGDLTSYINAKEKLFTLPGIKSVVLNIDDKASRKIAAKVSPATKVLYYGFNLDNSDLDNWVQGRNLKFSQQGFSLEISSHKGEGTLCSNLLGAFNASNVLAVIAVLLELGLDLDVALDVVGQLQSVDGRMQLFTNKSMPSVVIDYAHTPDALMGALTSLRQHCSGSLWCVFGCGGDRDKGKRALMGKAASELADHVIVTNDNPRSEDPNLIVNEILDGVRNKNKISITMDRELAIQSAVKEANPKDMILVAGKGHEEYQIIGKEKKPYSDKNVVLKVLGA